MNLKKNVLKIQELYEVFLKRNDRKELVRLRRASELSGIAYETLRTAIQERNLIATQFRNATNSPYYVSLKDLAEFCINGCVNGAIQESRDFLKKLSVVSRSFIFVLISFLIGEI